MGLFDDSNFLRDAANSALNGLGFGSGEDAAKTIGKVVRGQISGPTQPALTPPAPAPAPKFSSMPASARELFDKKLFGVSYGTLAFVGVGTIAAVAVLSMMKRRR